MEEEKEGKKFEKKEFEKKEFEKREPREMGESEKRVRAITRLYYSRPDVAKAIFDFAQGREVVPRYFEGFGKRPDTIIYPSDVMGLVSKGATSFHASEEIWSDPLKINSDMQREDLDDLRTSWDLLIDIDSKYLDYSKIAAILLIDALEEHGIKNYGIKFSGSKGFHIIVSGNCFPDEYDGQLRKNRFPEWPRAICEFLIANIRPKYNKIISGMNINFEALETRTKLTKEDVAEVVCSECGRPSSKGALVIFECPDCKNQIQRKDYKTTKRELRCPMPDCYGKLKVAKEEPYYFCEFCKTSSVGPQGSDDNERGKMVYSSDAKKSIMTHRDDFEEGIAGNKIAGLDLVLVAPRHLFRMPYSLHEKTALASVVIGKEDIEKFTPRDASPLNVKIRNFLALEGQGEGLMLLGRSLSWKKRDEQERETVEKAGRKVEYEEINISGVTEDMFPKPIKKLLKGGLNDGKKRGLFILITFLRSAGFSGDYIQDKVREWNKLNEQPLREGYIKAQVEWHLRQKKKILPPNYDNESFYKDLGLLEGKPEAKNPIVEVVRRLRRE